MADFKEGLVAALKAKYEAQVAESKVNIQVLLSNGVGVAEHPGMIETLDVEVTKLAEAEDKLSMVNKHFVSPPAPKVV